MIVMTKLITVKDLIQPIFRITIGIRATNSLNTANTRCISVLEIK